MPAKYAHVATVAWDTKLALKKIVQDLAIALVQFRRDIVQASLK